MKKSRKILINLFEGKRHQHSDVSTRVANSECVSQEVLPFRIMSHRYYAPGRREGARNKHCFRPSVCLSVCPSAAYIANNSRTRRRSCPNLNWRLPTLDATRIPVSRSNGQKSGFRGERAAGAYRVGEHGGHTACFEKCAFSLLHCIWRNVRHETGVTAVFVVRASIHFSRNSPKTIFTFPPKVVLGMEVIVLDQQTQCLHEWKLEKATNQNDIFKHFSSSHIIIKRLTLR